ncbi:hypothetical protein GA0061081_10358 [Gilliamella bombicola]|uniref:Lipoprotein n=1 Tax=Gilliamella bombicola TaxID=1798182 RepID=A0A1C4ANH1_9GAMM|nr:MULTISPECIES: hypothetical protein [Gilliamella]NUF26623.1 hypothetical protein [Gilliamella sp. ESL0254]SCB96164.1 hypothetical protein GA0061081_10358 [Gilliamella bombicola]
MKKLLYISILGFFLTGCGDGMPPSCDSKDAKKLLNEIITKQGGGQFSFINISDQLTLNEDKEQKRYLCQANVSFGGNGSFPVKYSVFLDKKNKNYFFVKIVN